jgi:glycosyltransferase involved in cell wall biosynthesis
MQVAILCNSFSGSNGVDRVVGWQAEKLSLEGNQVTIITLRHDMAPPQGVDVQVMSNPHGFLIERFWRLLFPLNFIKILHWLPKMKDYDIIYSHQYPLNWLAYLGKKRYGIRYIYYHHHLNPPEAYFGIIQRIYARVLNFMTLWTAKKADGAISISRYSHDSLLDEVGLDSEIIYNEIDTQRFHLGIDGNIVRNKFGLRDNPIILYVGGLRPSKRIHLLIKAFNLVKRQVPEAKLLLVGKKTFDKYFSQFEELCDDSVIFAGYVADEELPFYYAACDIYATASLWEGFDLPVVEAQACGKPVVAFDIGSHREVVNPEFGQLVPANDVEALARAMIEYLPRKISNGIFNF